MARITKSEREEIISRLQEWLIRGTKVYGLVVNVAPSGMSRTIRFLYVDDGEIGERPGRWVAAVIGGRYDENREAVRVSGCGMDMVYHSILSLSHALWGDDSALKQGRI